MARPVLFLFAFALVMVFECMVYIEEQKVLKPFKVVHFFILYPKHAEILSLAFAFALRHETQMFPRAEFSAKFSAFLHILPLFLLSKVSF